MSALINFSLNVAKLPKEKFIAGKDGAVYVNQTQEEREAKKQKTYLGNGKVVWNNGTIVNAEKVQEEVQEQTAEVEADGLPF